MVRFLMYANEWDIEGIIYSSSGFHWKGSSSWAGTKWIQEDIDQYAEAYGNLKKHDPAYPTPEALKKLVYAGNIDSAGEMTKVTPGSRRIVKVLLDDKPGTVYLQAWGGTNTIARALKTIQDKHPGQVAKVTKKAIVYIILDQDKTLRQYIQPNWPDLLVLRSFRQFSAIGYSWHNHIPKPLHKYFNAAWMKKNILEGHGPLCAGYVVRSDNHAFKSEGDSPSFMHQIDVGLRSLEHPSYGGWGGRFEREKGSKNVWQDAKDLDDFKRAKWLKSQPIWRWAEAFQNDWAARADWCVKGYNDANHPPAAKLDHDADQAANPGATVKLSAKGSKDPDGDELSYKWWQYREPGSYPGAVEIRNADRQQASFKVPDDAGKGQTVHIICEVTDNGVPPLTRYRRVIVTFRKWQTAVR